MLECCPICYQVTVDENPVGDDPPPKNGKSVEERFFQLFQRYLNRNISDDGSESFQNPPSSGSAVPFPLEGLRGMGMGVCLSCREVTESFCQLYEQWRKMELQLDWKVEQIKKLLEGESTLIKYVVESIDQLEVEERHKNGARQTIDALDKSKKALVAKCSQTLNRAFPRVSIRRSSAPPGNRKRECGQTGDKPGKRARHTEDQSMGHSDSGGATTTVIFTEMDVDGDSGTLMDGKVTDIDKPDKDKQTQSVVIGEEKSAMNPLQLISSAYSCSALEEDDKSNLDHEETMKRNFINIKTKYICNISKCGKEFSTLLGFRLHSKEKHNISRDLKNRKPDEKKAEMGKTGKSQSSTISGPPKQNPSLLPLIPKKVGTETGAGVGSPTLPLNETTSTSIEEEANSSEQLHRGHSELSVEPVEDIHNPETGSTDAKRSRQTYGRETSLAGGKMMMEQAVLGNVEPEMNPPDKMASSPSPPSLVNLLPKPKLSKSSNPTTRKPFIKTPYICSFPKCGKQFTTLRGIQVHSKDKHSAGSKISTEEAPTIDLENPETGGQFTCNLCPDIGGFQDEQEAQEHYSHVHPGLRYKCPDSSSGCPMEFGNPFSVYKHYWRTHRNMRFECDGCSHIFEDGFELLQHKQKESCCSKKIPVLQSTR